MTETAANASPTDDVAIVVAVWDVISAAAAAAAGVTRCLLSGAAFSAAHGYPDRGVSDLHEITQCAKQIVDATGMRLMVDIDGGLGSLPRMARLIDELSAAGVESVHVQDVDEAGQSKHSEHRSVDMAGQPSLADPEVLSERIGLIKEWTDGAMRVLARTDCLPGQAFDDSLRRLKMYDQAGADWFLPVFVPSFEALEETTATFPGRTASIVVRAVAGYTPSVADAARAGVSLAFVTGQYRNGFDDLKRVYRLCTEWRESEVFATRSDSRQLEDHLGLHRRGMSL
jgi:2-methylisocitrate lyase-like PEP mutase family enzyme